jgi:nucleoside-diphosphate-sugar epimerase
MKILLTGVTGFIGGEVLKQCLEHPFIDSILVLSRRSLNSGIKTDKELEVLIIEDFLNYGESVVEKFRDVDCCIW